MGGGGDQNSISVTSHGSKRPIRCCQEVEKCKVTVHFTSDSVSVSLAGSPVNSQRAVKVERCWRQTAAPPPSPPPPPHHQYSLIDPALLCIPINWTEGEAAVCRITSTGRHILLASFQSLNPTAINSAVLPFSLPFPSFPTVLGSCVTRASCSSGIIHILL